MGALIVIGCILGYLLLGGAYARSQAVAIYRRNREEWGSPQTVMIVWAFVLRALLWPLVAPFDAVKGPALAWIMQPVDERNEHAELLRQDARAWRAKQHDGTPAEREMAAELARICEHRAREVDL